MTSPELSVCICTFRRNHVYNTISSIIEQHPIDCTYEIVVADDDPEGFAADIVKSISKNTNVPVRYIRSGSKNVSAARNACLEAARGLWIVFIDDDETAEPGWLNAILDVRNRFEADIVKGFVRAAYPLGAAKAVVKWDPYTRDYGADGEIAQELATGNVLFRRTLLERSKVRFDLRRGATGGRT